jgi:hypothetical protein
MWIFSFISYTRGLSDLKYLFHHTKCPTKSIAVALDAYVELLIAYNLSKIKTKEVIRTSIFQVPENHHQQHLVSSPSIRSPTTHERGF